ncbi:MAG: PfkB family carbohydrate kinase [Candidatus Ranarchaeia archaeon]|jgi:2-dehydro-3-deoxygluconokinase
MGYDVVTFGEAMLRLSPPNHKRIEQATSFDAVVGGGEFNVAVAVSRFGLKSAWVSKLPDSQVGWLIRNRGREHGVDLDHVVWDKAPRARAGIYFLEFGAAPRPSSVLYDRWHAAVSQIKPGEIDWKDVFGGAKLFHTSGITPALAPNVAEVTEEAFKAANDMGVKVSYDLNYRGKLWTPQEANKFTEKVSKYIDILITTEEDTRVVYGIEATKQDEAFTQVEDETYSQVAKQLADTYGFEVVAITLRENPSVLKNTWGAMVYRDGKVYTDRRYEIEVIDRVGGGDSFSAGLIYGYLTMDDVQKGLEFGNAFSALKHSVPGDLNYITQAEVEKLVKGSGRGLRITR